MAKAENEIQKVCLEYLLKQGIFAWRQNNNSIFDARLNGYRSHTGLKGVPDILAVINGTMVGFECKTKTGKQSPDQLLFQKRLERNGGRYYLVRCLEDVKQAVTEGDE